MDMRNYIIAFAEAMFTDRKLLLAGAFLWDPFSSNGCRKLCLYSTDTHGQIEI
jgi:hypothetical protein